MTTRAWVLPAAALLAGVSAAAEDALRDSVVRITVSQRPPNFLQPWTKGGPTEAAATGFVIEGRRILTNAHVVLHAGQIYVQPHQSADKIPAKVAVADPDMDLALLTLEDGAFFEKRPALPLGDPLPRVKQSVNVYGYPAGGEQMSVTEGIISRIEYAPFFHSAAGTRVQIDAALNPGNSGGPAVSGGRVVGVAFSGVQMLENVGYLIPVEEVGLFLRDVADGAWNGKPRFRELVYTVENDALRAWMGIPKETGGLFIPKVTMTAPGYPLQDGDVITRIGDHALDNTGNVQVAENLQLSFRYYLPSLVKEGRVPVTVFRKGGAVDLQLPVELPDRPLVPWLKGRYPRYFIYGPLVFSTATRDLFALLGEAGQTALLERNSPWLTRISDQIGFEGEELVIVGSRFLAHPITKGYGQVVLAVVGRVNGVAIRNLAHLVEVLRDAKGEFVEFEFAGRGYEKLVFRRGEIVAATEEILSDNGIRKQCSEDLEKIWAKKE